MLHQRQRLAFGLEAGDHLLRVHAELEDFQGDLPVHRGFLPRFIDQSAAALAETLVRL